jgi:hypothetical protein
MLLLRLAAHLIRIQLTSLRANDSFESRTEYSITVNPSLSTLMYIIDIVDDCKIHALLRYYLHFLHKQERNFPSEIEDC